MSKAKEFFEKLTSDPKAQELFVNKEKPNTPEEMINAYIDAAKKLGYELTVEDIAEYYKEKEQEIKNGTDSAAKAIEKLPDDKLENAAGGRKHKDCKFTFLDGEKCWLNDSCDLILNDYKNIDCYKGMGCGAFFGGR